MLPPDLTRDTIAKQRFLQEAKAASALDHPNICTIHEINETADGQLYLVMAYYEGETLKERIERGVLALDEAVDIATQVGRGLAEAHRAGIVHRDIKPANLLLATGGMVKILDFGLAKLAGAEGVTQTGTTVGTVAYMSPEQARGQEVDHRTDIWSLGVVLYELLAGAPPFQGENLLAIADAIRSVEPTSLGGSASALNGAVTRAMSKDTETRYQAVSELLVDLRTATTPAAQSANRSGEPPIAVQPLAGVSPVTAPTVLPSTVTCRGCDHPNRASARFCEECGTPLVRLCPKCGTRLGETVKFCGECGAPTEAATPSSKGAEPEPRHPPEHLAAKILQAKTALEGERKLLAVLFVGIADSMDLADAAGTEEWQRIRDRFFEIVTAGVHRVEGTIGQHGVDSIMALFGAPIAHEDHARRACAAALHLQNELDRYRDELAAERRLRLVTRMGLNSGEVVVAAIGDDLRMEYTAVGQTVGLADGLESLASRDHAYLSASTAKLVHGFYELEDLGAQAVPGSTVPVPVFALVGEGALKSRFDLARQRGLARLVGRQAELAVLDASLERGRGGRGQVVGIVGEAGVGKSRLCAEFVERCRGRDVPVYEARGVADGRQIPLLPMLELFRAYFGIDDEADDAAARETVSARLHAGDQRLRDDLPILFQFLGIRDPDHPAPEMDPEPSMSASSR